MKIQRLSLLLSLFAGALVPGNAANQAPTYNKDVQPILSSR